MRGRSDRFAFPRFRHDGKYWVHGLDRHSNIRHTRLTHCKSITERKVYSSLKMYLISDIFVKESKGYALL